MPTKSRTKIRSHESRETQASALKILEKLYPDVNCALSHRSAWELLVSTILSAQCTDERVNKVTPSLFQRFPTVRDVAEASLTDLEDLIRSTGFFRTKAKNIREAARRILFKHKGEVPSVMEDLVQLPGVGRKTANVILGSWFQKNEGIVVDTHVKRLSRRLGFTKETDPLKIEKDLMRLLPKKDWTVFSHRMIWHGRGPCKARNPQCHQCQMAPFCPSAL